MELFVLTARMVASYLGICLSTLNGWLAADRERHPDDRRLTFHRLHGRKRLWSIAAFERLRLAVETESEPGGVLGQWRLRGAPRQNAVAAVSAQAALREVLQFRAGGGQAGDRRAAPAGAQAAGPTHALAKPGAA